MGVGQALDDQVEQVAGAQAPSGGDGHRIAEAERVELRCQAGVRRRRPCWPQLPPAAARRAARCSSASPGRSPARASTTNNARSYSPSAALAWLRTASAISPGFGDVDAAGVDQREGAAVPVRLDLLAVAGHTRLPWTTASRVPVRRLTSVDLPTFG